MNQTIIQNNMHQRSYKTIILDDDPTGTQTISNYYVYVKSDLSTLREALLSHESACFILTNSRSLTFEETKSLHLQIGRDLKYLSEELNIELLIISRSDSTLRQHYPVETQSLADGLNIEYDGELIIPALISAGRVTRNNVHYEIRQDQWIRCDQTDYAKDASFGYQSSNLLEWIEEKTQGKFRKEDILSIQNEWLKQGDNHSIQEELMKLHGFNKMIVNIETQADLEQFVVALEPILKHKRLMIRSAASFVGVFLGCFSQHILAAKELLAPHHHHGGLVVIGSHVAKTTEQLKALQSLECPLKIIEYDQHKVLVDGLDDETQRVVKMVTQYLKQGISVVVATRRERLDFTDKHPDLQLELTSKIADGLVSVVSNLEVMPRYLIAKGGITSSHIATKGLRAKRALVLGQALNCVPVWKIEGDRFAGLPYIVFPGNIGKDTDLRDLVYRLEEERK